MLDKVLETVLDYLKRTPYWSRIEPWTLAAFLYAGVIVCAFEYVRWRYGVTVAIPLFLRSYLFKQTSIGYVAVLASWIVLTYGLMKARKGDAPAPPQKKKPRMTVRITCIVLILATALF